MRSTHRRQQLVDRISSSLDRSNDGSSHDEHAHQIAETGATRSPHWSQSVAAWVCLAVILAVPVALLLYLLNR